MKLVSLILLVLVVACGKSSSGGGNKGPEIITDPSTSGPTWEIDSKSLGFPTKFALWVKSSEIFDTCVKPDAAVLTHGANGRTQIAFGHSYMPTQSFRVEIIDRGTECDQNVSWFAEDHVTYSSATVTAPDGTVLSEQVYVTLGN